MKEAFELNGVFYPNLQELHRAIAADWLSAGGENCYADVKNWGLLDESSDELAKTQARDWDLNSFGWFDHNELVAAFDWVKTNPKVVFDDDED